METKQTPAIKQNTAVVEQTLAIIKPDATHNAYLIRARIERKSLRVVREMTRRLSRNRVELFYSEHKGKEFFDALCEFMTSDPCIILILEGENVIKRWREIIGDTNPVRAERGTLRRMFGRQLPRNAVHGSANEDDAKREITFFFFSNVSTRL